MCSLALGAQERLRRLSVLKNQWRLLGGVSVRGETWGIITREPNPSSATGAVKGRRNVNWVLLVRYLVGLILQVFRRIISLGAIMHLGFLGGSECICLQCGRPGFDSWVRKIPWRREWVPTPVFLPGKSRGQRSLSMKLQSIRHDWVNNACMNLGGLPGGSVVKNPPAYRRHRFDPWVRKIPWRRKW